MREKGERRAEAERRCRPKRGPHRAEDDAGGERAEAGDSVVDAEREAAPIGRREIGDERLFGALREPEVEAVEQEPRKKRRQRGAQREADIDHRVDEPSDRDHRAAPDAVGPAPADIDTTALTTCSPAHISGT